MVKRLLFLFVLALLTLNVMAQQITEQQAKERALRYLASNSAAKTRGLNANATTRLDATKVEAQSIYAFNIDGGGYIIASADSRSLPVLGYSAKGKIDWEKMPENMRVWLKSYDAAMKTLGNRNDFVDGVFQHAIKVKKTRAERAPINPLLKLVVGQDHLPAEGNDAADRPHKSQDQDRQEKGGEIQIAGLAGSGQKAARRVEAPQGPVCHGLYRHIVHLCRGSWFRVQSSELKAPGLNSFLCIIPHCGGSCNFQFSTFGFQQKTRAVFTAREEKAPLRVSLSGSSMTRFFRIMHAQIEFSGWG